MLKDFYKCTCASHVSCSPASSTEAVRGVKLGKQADVAQTTYSVSDLVRLPVPAAPQKCTQWHCELER